MVKKIKLQSIPLADYNQKNKHFLHLEYQRYKPLSAKYYIMILSNWLLTRRDEFARNYI